MEKKRKRFIRIVCIVLAAIFMMTLVLSVIGRASAVSQSEINALKTQQAAIENQKSSLKSKLSDLETQKSSAMDQKAALDEQNDLAQQEIDNINQQITLYDGLIKEKADQLAEDTANVTKQKETLRVRMRAMEESGSLTYFAILFSADSFSDLLSRIDFVSSVMQYDNNLEDSYITAVQQEAKDKADYEATQEDQKATRVELQTKKTELEAQITAANELIAGLEKNISEYKSEYEANAAQEKDIQSQITKKVAELEKQQKAQSGSAIKGTGTWQWPVPSSSVISSPFGYRLHPIYGDMRFHSGIDISASSGSTIVAADSGTVVTAVYSSSYGNYVVISHGNNTTSLYAHMSSMAVTSGQKVTKGQTIGYVGSTGWSTGPHCHFEVKVNGTLVDPQSLF
jgi:murein DD-endopeptidase MepM/ murein hydrolase activator NlpD